VRSRRPDRSVDLEDNRTVRCEIGWRSPTRDRYNNPERHPNGTGDDHHGA